MATKSLVMDLSKEDELDGDDMWHHEIHNLLNEKEVLETLDYVVVEPEPEPEHDALLEDIEKCHIDFEIWETIKQKSKVTHLFGQATLANY